MALAQSRETGMETELLVGPPDDPERYLLDRRVSVDREAATWHGTRRIEELAITVRVRVTHPEAGPYLESDGTLRRWRWQAELVNSLDHPALERVRDLFVGAVPRPPGADPQGRVLALVTNWMGGRRLDTRIGARTGTDAHALVPILSQLADVVDRLHDGVGGQTIVHRTLGPTSIYVDRGRVHLEGLGSARPATADLGAVPGVAPNWTPPEVLKGQPFRPEGDRWCIGALTHVLITGAPPPLLSPAETVDQLLAAPVLRGDPSLVGHILRLLTPEPSLRPPALTPWVEELAEMLRSPAPAPVRPRPTEEPVSNRPTRPSGPGVRAAPDTSAEDPRTSLLLEWDPASLDPLLPCVRDSHGPIGHDKTLGRRLLPFAAASATVVALLALFAGGGSDTDPAPADAAAPGVTVAPAPPTTAAPTGGAPAPTAPPASPVTSTVASSAPAPTAVAVDGFDDAGRSTLDGGALSWTALSGEWTVTDGAAHATAADGAGVALATVDTGAAPSVVAAKILGISPGAGINVRVVDADTYWAFVYLPTADATWQLLRIDDGGIAPVATFAGDDFGNVSLEVRLAGNDLTVVVNGEALGTVTDSRDAGASAVGIGMAASAMDQTSFDDVRITS